MNARTVEQLLALNRAFYTQFATTFARTRKAERLNVQPMMPYITDGVKVLDVGCGNGRLAERLEREGRHIKYVGVDWIPELIEAANARKTRLKNIVAEFRTADLTTAQWATMAHDEAPFDVIVALAVLHHLPSYALRERVLRDCHALLRVGGHVIMTNWQFMQDARLRSKIVSWAQLGIDADEVEAGDALLDWKRGGEGYRYCHQLTADEIARMARPHFRVVTQFPAEKELNLWSVLQRV